MPTASRSGVRIVNHAGSCRGRAGRARARAPTAPTSSRCAAIRAAVAAGCCRLPRPIGASPSATTDSTTSSGSPTSPSRSRAESVEPVDDSSPDGSDSGRSGPPALDADARARRDTRCCSWTIWCTDRPAPPDAADEAARPADQAALFPAIPRVSRRRGCRGLPRLGARHDVRRQRPRAVQPRHQALRVATSACSSTKARAPDQRYIAAGVPWFTTLFGRDALISAFQALAFRPQIAVETLDVLAAYQATEDDPWRDAEPGKILHELRTGEMARSGELPHTPYYGSVDSTPLWLILLGATFDWTGDRAMVDRLWPNALAALDLDRPLRRPRRRRLRRVRAPLGARAAQPGLEGLQRRHPRPDRSGGRSADRPRRGPGLRLRRQASDGAPRPRCVARPSWRHASTPRPTSCSTRFEVGVLGRGPALLRDGLDADKRQSDAIGSNAGHCLWSGIVSPERARDVVEQLLQPVDVLRLGRSAPTPPASRATTRSATTPGRSGRTTRR